MKIKAEVAWQHAKVFGGLILCILALGVVAHRIKELYIDPQPVTHTVKYDCWVEPSLTPEGYEVIAYPVEHDTADSVGFEVPCPGR